MRISARAWGKQEKTRLRLVAAWEDAQKREPVRRWDGSDGNDKRKGVDDDAPPPTPASRRLQSVRKMGGGSGGSDTGDGRSDDCVEVKV